MEQAKVGKKGNFVEGQTLLLSFFSGNIARAATMEQQNIRINDLLASHVWEPQPTNQVGTIGGNI